MLKTKDLNNSLNSGIKKNWTSGVDLSSPSNMSKVTIDKSSVTQKYTNWSDDRVSQNWWQTHHLLWGSGLTPPAKGKSCADVSRSL